MKLVKGQLFKLQCLKTDFENESLYSAPSIELRKYHTNGRLTFESLACYYRFPCQ